MPVFPLFFVIVYLILMFVGCLDRAHADPTNLTEVTNAPKDSMRARHHAGLGLDPLGRHKPHDL